MAYLQTVINTVVVLGVGVLITWITRTQIGDVRRELGEVKDDIRDLQHEVASVRSDLTQIALAVGARSRLQTG